MDNAVGEASVSAPPEDAPGPSSSQGAQEGGSQRPPSGENRYQLTVAQRAKEAAGAGKRQYSVAHRGCILHGHIPGELSSRSVKSHEENYCCRRQEGWACAEGELAGCPSAEE